MRYVQILLGLSALCSTPVSASGQPDPSFGENGTVVIRADRLEPAGDEGLAGGLIDHKGRYVSFGSATYKPDGYFDTTEPFEGHSGLITRHLPDGQPDPAFATGGAMHQEVFNYYLAWGHAVELPDGKLLLAGNRRDWYWPIESPSSIVCRVTEDGTLDATFALNGCRALDFYAQVPSIDLVQAMSVMGDGRIVLLGTVFGGPAPYAIARLGPDGEDDVCFGDATCQDGGLVYAPDALADVDVRDMVVSASGAITVAGLREVTGEPNDPQNVVDTYTSVVFRLKPNGSIDMGFGIDGLRRIDYSALFPNDLITQGVTNILEGEDGGIIIVGSISLDVYPEKSVVAIAKLDASGSLAANFAESGLGIRRYQETAVRNLAFSASRQSDGKILIAGLAESENQETAVLLRLDASGHPDVHFGDAGTAPIPFVPGLFWMDPGAVASSGSRIVLFGNSAMDVQDFNPWLAVLDRDKLFNDAFEPAD